MLSAKDQSCALIFNEMASIMTTLNLLDKYWKSINIRRNSADSYETYQWIGPDLLSPFLPE
jgi:hypothetical protein